MTWRTPAEVAQEAHQKLDNLSLEYSSGRAKYHEVVRQTLDEVRGVLVQYESTRAAEFTALREAYEAEVDRERARAVRTARDLEKERVLREGKRVPMELQELADQTRRVKFEAPKNERGYARDWLFPELEEAIILAKSAGADSETTVTVTHRSIEMDLPFAEAGILVPGRKPAPSPSVSERVDPVIYLFRVLEGNAWNVIAYLVLFSLGVGVGTWIS